jgi:hypothetical protein
MLRVPPRSRVRSLARLTAVAALLTVGAGGVPAPAWATTPGARLWVKHYSSPGSVEDVATALGVSPDGSRVFVTGRSVGPGSSSDYATAAYDAVSGGRLWVTRYDSPEHATDEPDALGVSPDGSTVFVTGSSWRSIDLDDYSDYVTVAYDASTGEELWSRRYDGPGNAFDDANALGVSPDGSEVFVTGSSRGTPAADLVTLAYDASTGARLWLRRYHGPETDFPYASADALGVSSDGSAVFVTGEQGDWREGAPTLDYATVAYDASTGAKLWASRYRGRANGADEARALGVSPDGSRVYVTGESHGPTSTYSDFLTVAYDASSGARLWVSRFNVPQEVAAQPNALEVSPDGSGVFVTGMSIGRFDDHDYTTVAYDADSGATRWVRRAQGVGGKLWDVAEALAVSPDGSTVFVTGVVGHAVYGTAAYDAATGALLWVKWYLGRIAEEGFATAIGVSPDGSEVFVTGANWDPRRNYDYVTVAYRAR